MVCLRGVWLFVIVLVSGCASYGAVKNIPLKAVPETRTYSLKSWAQDLNKRPNKVQIALAFSGGGTRAAAFSYGVLKALRDNTVSIAGHRVRLLDEVDSITSVSGGSFTAAYYGLRGERIFDEFETVFLRRDVEGALKAALFNPFNWFRTTGRTERAIEYYDENIFRGATFADMSQENRPLIVINATDLAYGVRFSFLQEYFSLLCSDLGTFPVARAVAASSAVPVVFNPVVVENYPDCNAMQSTQWLTEMRRRAAGDERLTQLVDGLASGDTPISSTAASLTTLGSWRGSISSRRWVDPSNTSRSWAASHLATRLSLWQMRPQPLKPRWTLAPDNLR